MNHQWPAKQQFLGTRGSRHWASSSKLPPGKRCRYMVTPKKGAWQRLHWCLQKFYLDTWVWKCQVRKIDKQLQWWDAMLQQGGKMAQLTSLYTQSSPQRYLGCWEQHRDSLPKTGMEPQIPNLWLWKIIIWDIVILGHEFSERPTLNVQQAISYLEGWNLGGQMPFPEGSRAQWWTHHCVPLTYRDVLNMSAIVKS